MRKTHVHEQFCKTATTKVLRSVNCPLHCRTSAAVVDGWCVCGRFFAPELGECAADCIWSDAHLKKGGNLDAEYMEKGTPSPNLI